MIHRFYTSFPPTEGTVILQGPEARHLATVMRAKPGDSVVLFCGDGSEYFGFVESVGKRDVTLSVNGVAMTNRELPLELEIATAMPKGDRSDFMIEKLTELGVRRIIPLATERSVAHPRIERLQRAVIEASKQCGRNVLMEIAEVTKWSDYCCKQGAEIEKYISHINQSTASFPNWFLSTSRPNKVVIAIGPEGGWTDNEVEQAIANKWITVSLGSRILRIETAAIAAASYWALSSFIRA